jgi:hypothetical protein
VVETNDASVSEIEVARCPLCIVVTVILVCVCDGLVLMSLLFPFR